MKRFENIKGLVIDDKGFRPIKVDILVTSDKKGTTMSVFDEKKQVQYTFAITNEIKKEIMNNEK